MGTRVIVQWTHHAKDRADERSGLKHTEIEKRCWNAYCGKSYGYWPKNKPRECWVAVDGPRGKATAIVTLNTDGDGILIVTIRESETCGQGERANEPMKHRPLAALGRKK